MIFAGYFLCTTCNILSSMQINRFHCYSFSYICIIIVCSYSLSCSPLSFPSLLSVLLVSSLKYSLLVSIFKKLFIFIYIYDVLSAYEYVYHVYDVPEGSRRKAPEPLETELRVVLRGPVSAECPVLLTTEPLLGLSCCIYSITLPCSRSPLPLDLFLSSCSSQLNPHTTLGSSALKFALSTAVSCSLTGTSGGGRSDNLRVPAPGLLPSFSAFLASSSLFHLLCLRANSSKPPFFCTTKHLGNPLMSDSREATHFKIHKA